MILQALHSYYERKSADPEAHVAPPGFEWKEIPFLVEIDSQGTPIQIVDTRDGEGKKKRAQSFLVPQGAKKSVNVAANFLWGTAEYVLKIPDQKKLEAQKAKGKEARYRKRLDEMNAAFVEKIEKLSERLPKDPGIRAMIRFYGRSPEEGLERYKDEWEQIKTTNPNMTFRLQGDQELVCQRPAVRESVQMDQTAGEDDADKFCLVTGQGDEIERLHPAIKGVWGAQTSGANIVSYNLDAFNSYAKAQGANAPVGRRASFGYTTALNHLLGKDSRQRLQVGDTSTVFWADKPTEWEAKVPDIFGEPPKDDPDRHTRTVEGLYKAIDRGLLEKDESKTKFFVLGLTPNAARIAIRFWHQGTVSEMAARIRRHFDDLAILCSSRDPLYLSIFRLLTSVATQGKADNIPPNLGGELIRSIFADLPYPHTLLSAAVRRIRAEQNVTYPRAALIKACINRAMRYSNDDGKEELRMSLDETNANVGYRLGRLFAVLEKAQEEANPGINATIRDRYYGAASSTPMTVFSTLLKLKNHHLSKLENRGRAVNLEKRIGEIMEGLDDFPAQLALAEQGRFAIGYYHQRQDFFTKSEPASSKGA